jgi:hypothetical protein
VEFQNPNASKLFSATYKGFFVFEASAQQELEIQDYTESTVLPSTLAVKNE